MSDNSAALTKARRRESHIKRSRARTVLLKMAEAGEPVTFAALARQAGVSVSLLYADNDLAADIAATRDRQRDAGVERAWRTPTRSLVTEQSLRTDLSNATEQIRQLHEDVALLRERLARGLGAEADITRGRATEGMLDRLEERATELEADNHELRQRVANLETELTEANDSLHAARAANRDVMNMLNR